MLCDKCGKKTATMHYQQIVNGVKSEYHLCPDCAGEESPGIDLLNFDPFHLWGPVKVSDRTCKSCGMTLSGFQKGGLLGCADCYSAFEAELLPMLSQIHGSNKHVEKGTAKKEASKKVSDTLPALEAALKEAILAEEYEKAAVLRDKIRKMKEAQ